MNLADLIIKDLQNLPKTEQMEIFDFVKYLQKKIEKKDNKDWDMFSVSAAMKGMEDEISPYSLDDLKERFS